MSTTTRRAALALLTGVGLAQALPSWAAEAETAPLVTYKQVHALTGNEGDTPQANLVKGPDGYFYGTAETGGDLLGGTAFRMNANGATQVLHVFGQRGDGWRPQGLTWSPDGHFYGVTAAGGNEGRGTFYRLSLDGELSILYSFSAEDGLAVPSHAVMLSSDGNFYGVTSGGGGAVYRITPDGALTVLHHFEDNDIDGLYPWGGLIEDGAGNLYGTTYYGGIHGEGIVFRLTRTGVMKILHAFGSGRGDGAGPSSGLLRLGKMLYGVTLEGGLRNEGTIYRLSTTGSSYQRLHSFSSLSGDPHGPRSDLVQAADGHLYGTTLYGGAANKGTVYRFSLAGELTPLHAFGVRRGDGVWPRAGLLSSGKSTLYGTTDKGGADDNGTVYKLSVVN